MSQRSFTSSSWSLIGVSAVALTLVAASGGCELIAKVDRDLIPGPTGGGTAEGGGGAGAMGGMGGEGGGMGGCDMPSDCPGEDTTCSARTCVNQVCGTDLAPAGTPCTEDGGTQCDGAGMCVTPQCMNGVVDGTETDVDCGGAECPACDNGDICVEGADCTSGFCEPQGGAGGGGGTGGQGGSGQGGSGGGATTGLCAPCGVDGDCDNTMWCNAGVCEDKGVAGTTCGGDNECASDHCVDGVCCDTACDGTCEVCSLTGLEGTCTAYPAGTDPESECGADVCDGASSCRCTNNTMDGMETDVDCGGGICGACGANAMCSQPSDCLSGVCTGGTCAAPTCGDGILQTGEGCDDGNQNNNDACPDGVGGTCQPATCGDGFTFNQGGGTETCDDGNNSNNDACPDGTGGTCLNAVCGDGFVFDQGGGTEVCDDGNGNNNDACPDGTGGTCLNAVCGDGFIFDQAGGTEVCDDGNGNNNDACPDGTGGTCLNAVCGDGFVFDQGGTESCDDGNGNNNDDCPDGTAGSCVAATCSDGFLHNQGTGDETDVDCGGTVCNACPGGVLLSELVVTPTDGEFIELYNPTTETVDLSNVYLADFNTYYLVTQGTATVVSSDFLVKFPLGTSLAADARVTIALETATSHNTNYGSFPDFDLSPADVAAPSMELLGATTVAGGLTNSGEMLVAFYWDGTSDLVKDIDYITYGNTTNAMDKTGVTVGAGTYLAETAVLSQDPGANPGSLSLSRCDFAEGTETQTGGNGYLGHDETSENSSATWSATTPSPGGSNLCPSTATAALNFGDAKILASATDLSGDLIVVGSYTEAPLVVGAFTLPNAGADDLFVAKISGSDNSVTWAVGFGGTSSDLAQAVAIDPGTGDVFVGGAYQSATLDFTGGLGTALTNSGGGQFDAFVAKLSGVDGSHLWSVGAGGSGSYDTVNGLAAEATGDVVAAGFFESTSINFGTTTLVNSGTGTGEAFAVRLGGSAGAEVWAILSGVSTTASDQFFGVAIDGAGGFVYLVGHGNGFGNGNFDPFVEQVDLATGVSSDVTTGDGASGDDFAYTVAVDSAGGIAVGGQFSSATVDWSGAITTSVSSSGDAYVVTLDTGTTGLPALAAWTPTAASAASQIKSLLYVGLNPYAGGAFSGAGFDAGGGAMADAGGGFNTLVVSLDASLAHRYSLTGSNASGVDTVDSLAGGSAGLFASGGFGAASLDWGGTSSALTNLGGTDAFAVRIVP